MTTSDAITYAAMAISLLLLVASFFFDRDNK